MHLAWDHAFIGALALAGSTLLCARPSHADKPATTVPDPNSTAELAPKLELEGPEAEAKERARAMFQRGVSAYRDGKYYEAVEIFLATQLVYPDTQLCFNVARAYENLGNTGGALRYYRDYLRQADRPSDGNEVQERVRYLEGQLSLRGVQQFTVLSTPERATVVLDGRPVGITPWTGETYPGKHRLQLTLAGHLPLEQVVEVVAHAARDVPLVLLPQPSSPGPLQQPVSHASWPKETRPVISVPTLVTLGTGLALLGSALAAEAAAGDAGISRTGAFFAGAGLGVSVVGSVMLYFDLTPRSSPRRTATTQPP